MGKKKRNRNKKGKAAARQSTKQPNVGDLAAGCDANKIQGKNDSSMENDMPNSERVMSKMWKELRLDNGKSKEEIDEAAERLNKEYGNAFMKDLEMMIKRGQLKPEDVLRTTEHLIETGTIKREDVIALVDKETRAAALRDDALFKDHPPQDDCEICYLPLPLLANQKQYKVCCGKVLCLGCIVAMRDTGDGQGDRCPFCRKVTMSSNTVEFRKLVKKRVGLNDPNAFMTLADMYLKGTFGYPKDEEKALEMMVKAGELGCANALCSLGRTYYIQEDMVKAKHYFELAAINGSVEARYDLASRFENTKATFRRGVKHMLISARAGFEPSMAAVKDAFMRGWVTKDEYGEALRAFQTRTDEMKSTQRENAYEFYNGTKPSAMCAII